MSNSIPHSADAITSAALALPFEQRAALADALLRSLPTAQEAELRSAWSQEIRDRFEAFDRGEMKAYSRDEVMHEIRSRRPS